MADTPTRFGGIRRSARLSGILIFFGIAVLVFLAGYRISIETESTLAAYVVPLALLAGACILGALSVYLWCLVRVILKVEAHSFRSYDVLRDIQSVLEGGREDLKVVAENAQLSELVRSVTHRGRERTALRLAINEEIIRGDWEAAYALVEQLESRHGYKNEAMRLREEVDRSRQIDRRDKLHEAIEQVRSHMASRDWDRARREMDRLAADHPDSPEVRELPKRFARMRNEHKRRLLKDWDEAVQRNEVDRGIAVLKQLDQFLTPNEAAALEESARGVFRAKLRNLAVQFSLAVTGQNWVEAYEVGREITRDFPNSRMAQEVRERIHVLAKRVEEAAVDESTVNLAQE
ncbi:MAG: hypothetical protein ACE5E1_10850 [Phycisphaerae bacterium]